MQYELQRGVITRIFRKGCVIKLISNQILSCCPKDSNGELVEIFQKYLKQVLRILLPFTEFYINIVIERNEAILMRTLVAIVVRLLRRLKKPSRIRQLSDDDFSRPITAKILILYNKYPSPQESFGQDDKTIFIIQPFFSPSYLPTWVLHGLFLLSS